MDDHDGTISESSASEDDDAFMAKHSESKVTAIPVPSLTTAVPQRTQHFAAARAQAPAPASALTDPLQIPTSTSIPIGPSPFFPHGSSPPPLPTHFPPPSQPTPSRSNVLVGPMTSTPGGALPPPFSYQLGAGYLSYSHQFDTSFPVHPGEPYLSDRVPTFYFQRAQNDHKPFGAAATTPFQHYLYNPLNYTPPKGTSFSEDRLSFGDPMSDIPSGTSPDLPLDSATTTVATAYTELPNSVDPVSGHTSLATTATAQPGSMQTTTNVSATSTTSRLQLPVLPPCSGIPTARAAGIVSPIHPSLHSSDPQVTTYISQAHAVRAGPSFAENRPAQSIVEGTELAMAVDMVDNYIELMRPHQSSDSKMSGLIKDALPVRGLNMGRVRYELHAWYKNYNKSQPPQTLNVLKAFVFELMHSRFFEDKLASILFMQEVLLANHCLKASDLHLFHGVFHRDDVAVYKVCDHLADKVLYLIAKHEPHAIETMFQWCEANDKWQARAGLSALLNFVDSMPHLHHRLLQAALNLMHRPDEEAKSAAGGMLRELSKFMKERVVEELKKPDTIVATSVNALKKACTQLDIETETMLRELRKDVQARRRTRADK